MPDDIWFEEIDPLLYMYMYECWACDLEEKYEFAKNHAILNGAFTNPDMARQMMNQEGTNIKLSDEEFDESTRMVLEDRERKLKAEQQRNQRKRRRHRRRVITEE